MPQGGCHKEEATRRISKKGKPHLRGLFELRHVLLRELRGASVHRGAAVATPRVVVALVVDEDVPAQRVSEGLPDAARRFSVLMCAATSGTTASAPPLRSAGERARADAQPLQARGHAAR